MVVIVLSIFSVTFAFAYVVLKGFIAWAIKNKILDYPSERGLHTNPTARGGGVVIVGLTLLGLWLFYYKTDRTDVWPLLLTYTLGSVLIANIGWLDDLRPLPVRVRLISQCISAFGCLFVLCFRSAIAVPIYETTQWSWVGATVALVWIVGMTNAFNFMDGIDGIAGSQGLVAGLGWFIVGWQSGSALIEAIGLLVAGCCLGFLMHNWEPARVFMGDAGSSYLGFTFGVLPLMYGALSENPDYFKAIVLGLMFLWPFVFDTALTAVRRLMNKESILQPHRTHLYQRLVGMGWRHSSVTLLYSALSTTGVAYGLIWSTLSATWKIGGLFVLPSMCIGLWVFVSTKEKYKRAAS
jgi:UDP-N-acetylmuramyl pentapeptide phosphotransferase/UDP-N-acetylglucosamine-1-phosphate transferase